MTNKIGNAKEINPPITIPIKIIGRNTTVKRIFVIYVIKIEMFYKITTSYTAIINK